MNATALAASRGGDRAAEALACAIQNRSAGSDFDRGAVRVARDALQPIDRDVPPMPAELFERELAAARRAAVRLSLAPACDLVEAREWAETIVQTALQPDRTGSSESKRRFPFISLGDFLDLPPVEWCINGLLTKGGLSALFGAPGHGKSTVGVHLALTTAFGVPFYPGYDCVQGAVGYVAAEGAAGLPAHVRAWLAHSQVAEDHRPPVYFLRAAPQLMQMGDTAELLEDINALGVPLAMLIVDTYARTAVGLDENHSKDVGQYVAGLELIQRGTGAHVMILGHTGWNIERERGSTALRAAVDTAVLVTKDDNRVRFSCLKQKDAAEFPELTFEMRPVGTSVVVVPLTDEERRRAPATLPLNRQRALDALRNADEGGGASYTKWHETSGIPKPTFNRCKDDLVSWGLIRKTGKKYEALS